MADDIQGNIGTTLKFVLGTPTTWDEAGVDVLEATATEVGFIETIGDFGGTATVETFTALVDGIVRKAIGTKDYGTASITLGRVEADVGQAALKSGFDGDNAGQRHTAIVTYKDGLREAFGCLVSSDTRSVGSAGPFIRAGVDLAIDTKVYGLTAYTAP
ncbi:MAG: hypothetical protein ACPHUL_00810 [Marinomonas gallaica]